MAARRAWIAWGVWLIVLSESGIIPTPPLPLSDGIALQITEDQSYASAADVPDDIDGAASESPIPLSAGFQGGLKGTSNPGVDLGPPADPEMLAS